MEQNTAAKRSIHADIIIAAGSDLGVSEEARHEDEFRFRQLLANLPAAAYACDKAGFITYFNRRAAALWSRSRLGTEWQTLPWSASQTMEFCYLNPGMDPARYQLLARLAGRQLPWPAPQPPLDTDPVASATRSFLAAV